MPEYEVTFHLAFTITEIIDALDDADAQQIAQAHDLDEEALLTQCRDELNVMIVSIKPTEE